jgi:hypothetical protein
MKSERLFPIAEYIMESEMKKFEDRITDIFEDLTIEYTGYSYEILSQILYDDAKRRFELYYPLEPFFKSIFNKVYDIYEINYSFDDIEDKDELKFVEKMRTRKREE